MKLADYIAGRDNNFNLIRIIAAYGVLVSHCYPLALGHGAVEPPGSLVGMSFGSMAVDIFFFASGFLVTGSLLARQDTVAFLKARALRIFPALFVMLVLTVGTLGMLFSTVPAADFFSDPATRKYFLRCLTLINGVKYELPGVFGDNPYAKAVNGSLWSMHYELRLYLILALLWAAMRLAGIHRLQAFRITVVAGAAAFGMLMFASRFGLTEKPDIFYRLGFMFLGGGSFYILRARIVLSTRLTCGLAVALTAAAVAGFDAFFVVYSLAIGYLLLWAAYVPGGIIRRYNAVGDYSYGVYIYAFPLQQTVAALIPGVTVLQMLLLSSLATLACAILSWRLVEEKALALKDKYPRRVPPGTP